MSRKKKVDPEELVAVPFSQLVLHLGEIGIHRGRKYGFRDVFGFRTLRGLPFVELAQRVKDAYEGRNVPSHKGWPKQKEALQWLVDKGPDAMYQFKDDVRVRSDHHDRYYVIGGHHRSLALYILGADSVRAAVEK